MVRLASSHRRRMPACAPPAHRRDRGRVASFLGAAADQAGDQAGTPGGLSRDLRGQCGAHRGRAGGRAVEAHRYPGTGSVGSRRRGSLEELDRSLVDALGLGTRPTSSTGPRGARACRRRAVRHRGRRPAPRTAPRPPRRTGRARAPAPADGDTRGSCRLARADPRLRRRPRRVGAAGPALERRDPGRRLRLEPAGRAGEGCGRGVPAAGAHPWQRRIVATSFSYVGYPYVWGGTGQSSLGFDRGPRPKNMTSPAASLAAPIRCARGRPSPLISIVRPAVEPVREAGLIRVGGELVDAPDEAGAVEAERASARPAVHVGIADVGERGRDDGAAARE